MKLHGNAKLTPATRRLLVERIEIEGWTVYDAAVSVGVSERTGHKWLRRFRDGGEAALRDRSSRPKRCPHETSAKRGERILQLRRGRLAAWEIAARLRMPRSTVSRILHRQGLGRLSALEPKEPVRRYEKSRPGEMVHIDIKKLARFRRPGHRVHGDRTRNSPRAGWEHAHVAVDAYSRFSYAEVLPDEKKETVSDFLSRVHDAFRRQGIRIERILTDRGPGYSSKLFSTRCKDLGVRHSRTRPYRPQTNGKAERFIQTLTRKWAYGRTYQSSAHRARALPKWIDHYNQRRPHHAIGLATPAERLRAFE
jgi:transposase InsO family protein